MIQKRVTVYFQPGGGSSADAVPAANQEVFLDLQAGTMSLARTDSTGLLVAGTPTAPVELEDARTYSVMVQPSFGKLVPAAAGGAKLQLDGAKLYVTPKIAIRVTTASTAPAAALACQLSIAGIGTPVKTSANGWIISNDQTAGAVTLTTANKLLRLSTDAPPEVTLALATPTPARGDTVRINVSVPARTIGMHVTGWQYDLSHKNPDGSMVLGTIIRPATEDPASVDSYWEGVMCASGTVTASFIAGVTLRALFVAAIAATVVVMEPQKVTLAVTLAARAWTSTVNWNPESTMTKTIVRYHDTGGHDWLAPTPSATDSTIAAGPNGGCRFVTGTAGLTFTSTPLINTDVLNLTSDFQKAQGQVRIVAPSRLRGQTLAPPLVAINGSSFSIPSTPALVTELKLTKDETAQFKASLCISAEDLLAGTRAHEHLARVSHKSNCQRAIRALDPAAFIEGFVQGPSGTAMNFNAMLLTRTSRLLSATLTHNEIDEMATAKAGDLKFIPGSTIPRQPE